MADALRGSMDAAEYKHVVLGLIFLKYISDAFEERRASVLAEFGEDAAEDRDEYTPENVDIPTHYPDLPNRTALFEALEEFRQRLRL